MEGLITRNKPKGQDRLEKNGGRVHETVKEKTPRSFSHIITVSNFLNFIEIYSPERGPLSFYKFAVNVV